MFNVLKAGLVYINRLFHHLMSNPTALTFEMRAFVLQDLLEASEEFQKTCFAYESKFGNPATALNAAISDV